MVAAVVGVVGSLASFVLVRLRSRSAGLLVPVVSFVAPPRIPLMAEEMDVRRAPRRPNIDTRTDAVVVVVAAAASDS